MRVKQLPTIPAVLLAVSLAACGGGNATLPSPQSPVTSPKDIGDKFMGNIKPSTADAAAASQASQLLYHIMKPNSGTGRSLSSVRRPMGVAYPGDLLGYGGYTVNYANFYNIFVSTQNVSCSASCWGASIVPGLFLSDLFNSNLIHVVDQYEGLNANNRFQIAGHFTAQVSAYASQPGANPVISQSGILSMLHDAIKLNGNAAGYSNVYNVFIPPNTDTCFDFSPACYSPDQPSNFAFCGYHGSVDFPDLGVHALFSVEPYDNVQGCQVNYDGLTPPNGIANDSQDSVLMHEMFETITDPDPGQGWYNSMLGEIGDECQGWGSIIDFGGQLFETQTIYSNAQHGCTNSTP